jgi:hypothetical protein
VCARSGAPDRPTIRRYQPHIAGRYLQPKLRFHHELVVLKHDHHVRQAAKVRPLIHDCCGVSYRGVTRHGALAPEHAHYLLITHAVFKGR